MQTKRNKRNKRKPMAEINVVPYIDVMLVLLVIFMITAPLLNLGVEVDLPKADAEPLDSQQSEEPMVVTVLKNGDLYLNAGGEVDGVNSGLTQRTEGNSSMIHKRKQVRVHFLPQPHRVGKEQPKKHHSLRPWKRCGSRQPGSRPGFYRPLKQ